MGSILPPASLPVERRKASSETLNLWFTEPVSTTVGRLLRLSPVLSFRPTEIDLAAAAVVQQRWDALDESLRQVLGKDYLRKTVEEEIAKVRQFIAALRDFGTGRSGLFGQEVYARSLEAWAVQIMGSDDCSPVRSDDSQACVSDAADEAAVEVPPPPAALAGSSAEAPAAEAPEVASGDQALPTAAAQSSSDEETQTPALKQGSRTASSSDEAASVPALQQGTQPAATLPKPAGRAVRGPGFGAAWRAEQRQEGPGAAAARQAAVAVILENNSRLGVAKTIADGYASETAAEPAARSPGSGTATGRPARSPGSSAAERADNR